MVSFSLLFLNFICTAVAYRCIYVDEIFSVLRASRTDSLSVEARQAALDLANRFGGDCIIMYEVNRILPDYAPQLRMWLALTRELGIERVAVSGETASFIEERVLPFQAGGASPAEQFNVFNLEFEYWNPHNRDYYCDTYVRSAKGDCERASMYAYFMEQLVGMRALAGESLGEAVEAYVGWPTADEMGGIIGNVDMLHVHAYVTDPSKAAHYAKERLQWIADADVARKGDVSVIFSAELDFMKGWLNANSMAQAEDEFCDLSSSPVVTGFTYFTNSLLSRTSISSPGVASPDHCQAFLQPVAHPTKYVDECTVLPTPGDQWVRNPKLPHCAVDRAAAKGADCQGFGRSGVCVDAADQCPTVAYSAKAPAIDGRCGATQFCCMPLAECSRMDTTSFVVEEGRCMGTQRCEDALGVPHRPSLATGVLGCQDGLDEQCCILQKAERCQHDGGADGFCVSATVCDRVQGVAESTGGQCEQELSCCAGAVGLNEAANLGYGGGAFFDGLGGPFKSGRLGDASPAGRASWTEIAIGLGAAGAAICLCFVVVMALLLHRRRRRSQLAAASATRPRVRTGTKRGSGRSSSRSRGSTMLQQGPGTASSSNSGRSRSASHYRSPAYL